MRCEAMKDDTVLYVYCGCTLTDCFNFIKGQLPSDTDSSGIVSLPALIGNHTHMFGIGQPSGEGTESILEAHCRAAKSIAKFVIVFSQCKGLF